MVGHEFMVMVPVTHDSSRVNGADSDTDEQCDVIWAKVGPVCAMSLRTPHLMEDSAVPTNLSAP